MWKGRLKRISVYGMIQTKTASAETTVCQVANSPLLFTFVVKTDSRGSHQLRAFRRVAVVVLWGLWHILTLLLAQTDQDVSWLLDTHQVTTLGTLFTDLLKSPELRHSFPFLRNYPETQVLWDLTTSLKKLRDSLLPLLASIFAWICCLPLCDHCDHSDITTITVLVLDKQRLL